MKLQESKGRYSVFLPNKIVKAFGWEKGDDIQVTIEGKNKLGLKRD